MAAQKGRLLILDDEPAVGQTIAYIAAESGLDAIATTRAPDFFRELDRWCPTHIALDLIMPGLDGVEIIRMLGDRHCPAHLIITSGIGGRVLDAARRSAAEHGLCVTGVVSKPFSPRDLRAALAFHPQTALPADNAIAPAAAFQVTAAELRRALNQGELDVAYQPSVDCATLALVGFEALARWRHPVAGVILPDHFIPLAESTGLIDELTEQVVSQSLVWLSRHFPADTLGLAINISPRSLLNLKLGDRALQLSRRQGIAPERLTFELTESSAMEDPVKSLHLLTRLRAQGFQLALDDFGTGYSSMRQLVRLPFSELKVDKSFVIGAMESRESRTVIKSVVDLGHSLGLRVSAEGVEEAETLAFLTSLGCVRAQGFFLARPMFGDDVPGWAQLWASRCIPAAIPVHSVPL